MKKIFVCTNFRANPNNPSCAARGSEEVLTCLKQEIMQQKLPIEVEASPCMGFCDIGPNVHLVPSGPFLHGITTKNLGAVIKKTKQFLKEKN